MSTILIEKYVEGTCVEQLRLPVGPLQFLARLLPGQARRELRRNGLDIDALMSAVTPTQWLDVTEGNVATRVRVTRLD